MRHDLKLLAVPSHPHDGDGGDLGILEDGSSPPHHTAAAKKDGSKMVSLDDFDLIRVIGRGSYAKVRRIESQRSEIYLELDLYDCDCIPLSLSHRLHCICRC